eukprot:CAMPEP_0169429662 /NCGR_PEP_ID=MMETSP1042-20121227/1985_1 /TAXON_ID=464988 /ORGANISM="Hemiselmis andersenii, Strain CCMP1180" /LENGTH=51 /DNA_ID=CAMNT_0009539925 /DNA_START=622 /DNA_END=774 /DNA_ORIENTATION=+
MSSGRSLNTLIPFKTSNRAPLSEAFRSVGAFEAATRAFVPTGPQLSKILTS